MSKFRTKTLPAILASIQGAPRDVPTKNSQFTPTTHRSAYPAVDPTSPALSQAGKVVLITGASQGIGEEIALGFAAAKPKGLILSARNQSKLDAVAAKVREISPDTKVIAVSTDVANAASVKNLQNVIEKEFGHADVLVNGAGVWTGRGGVDEVEVDDWWFNFEINVKGVYLVTQAFLRLLGEERKGYVVTVTSGLGTIVYASTSAYSISKTAVLRFNEFLAAENKNIQAISFHPGIVRTGMVDGNEDFDYFADDEPELAAGVAVYLATDKAAHLNGRYFHVGWDVEEVEQKKQQILDEGLLTLAVKGKFGAQHYTTKSEL